MRRAIGALQAMSFALVPKTTAEERPLPEVR
jgi:hypothetical protein